MADLTTYPLIDGFETTLAQAWNGAVGTIYLNSVPNITFPSGVTTYLVVNPGKTTMQIAEIDSVNTTNITANCTNVTLDKGAGEAYTQSSHGVGSIVRISHNYQFWKDIADVIASKLDTGGGNGLEYANTTARDTALGGDGVATKNYRMVKAGSVYYNYNLSTGQWESVDTGTTTPDASPTVSGSVEIPTTAQMTAGDDTGETGAYLAVTPELLAAQVQSGSYTYGADAGGDDAYVVALVPTLTAYTVGQVLGFKATTANTGACTVNFGPSVLDIKTKDGNNPQSGVLRTDGFNYGYYDGTNFVLLQEDFATTSNRGINEINTDAEVITGTDEIRTTNAKQLRANSNTVAGNTVRTTGDSTGSQTIAHGLGQTPRLVELIFTEKDSTSSDAKICSGTYNGTTNQCIGMEDIGASAVSRLNTGNILVYENSSGVGWRATATCDNTNITLSRTKGGAGLNIDVIRKAHA